MAGTAFKDARVIEAAKAFEPVLVNVGSSAELAERHAIQVTPTVVFATPSGKSLVVTIDAVEADEILADMKSALEGLTQSAGDPK